MAVLGKSSISNLIKEMQEHEEKHLAKFEASKLKPCMWLYKTFNE